MLAEFVVLQFYFGRGVLIWQNNLELFFEIFEEVEAFLLSNKRIIAFKGFNYPWKICYLLI